MIQMGTKIISQLHVKNPSSLSGMNTNWSALTERKSSSSKLRSFCCFIAQMQKKTLTMLETISGMKTRIQRCRLWFESLSTVRNSNISKIRCSDKLISIDLNWMYESFSNRYWGFLRKTKLTTKLPATTKPVDEKKFKLQADDLKHFCHFPFQIHSGKKQTAQLASITSSSLSATKVTNVSNAQ